MGCRRGSFQAVFASGRRRFGPLALRYDAFAARATRFLPGPRPELSPDFYLAAACAEGVDGAWECFEHRYDRRLREFAVGRGLSQADAEELVHQLPGSLVQPPPRGGSLTRIGTYDGSCKLFTWLCSIVVRRIADRARARGGTHQVPAPVNDTLAAAEGSPAILCENRETARVLAETLAAAWRTLDAREATVLRLRYREGLPQTEIASRLGIGAPRVCRLKRGALAKLRAAIRRGFPALDPSDCTGCDDLRHATGFSLARLLSPRIDRRDYARTAAPTASV